MKDSFQLSIVTASISLSAAEFPRANGFPYQGWVMGDGQVPLTACHSHLAAIGGGCLGMCGLMRLPVTLRGTASVSL